MLCYVCIIFEVHMMAAHMTYQSQLTTRYASKDMAHNFSDQKKFSTWRRLWLILAQAEKVCLLIIIYYFCYYSVKFLCLS